MNELADPTKRIIVCPGYEKLPKVAHVVGKDHVRTPGRFRSMRAGQDAVRSPTVVDQDQGLAHDADRTDRPVKILVLEPVAVFGDATGRQVKDVSQKRERLWPGRKLDWVLAA